MVPGIYENALKYFLHNKLEQYKLIEENKVKMSQLILLLFQTACTSFSKTLFQAVFLPALG